MMLFSEYLTTLISVWDIQFAFSATADVSLGALAIFSQFLGSGISFIRGLMRG